MSNLIMNIAAQYPNLHADRMDRNRAFGVILNNTVVGCCRLKEASTGIQITNAVLRELGHVDEKIVEGNLDDF